jgi:phosphoribosylglycinamide formyltransferase-1
MPRVCRLPPCTACRHARLDYRLFAEREQFDAALAEAIDGFAPDLVVLAGFMRILGGNFVRAYEGD